LMRLNFLSVRQERWANLHLFNAALAGRPGHWMIEIADGDVVSVRPQAPVERLTEGSIDLEGRLVIRPLADVHLHLDKAFQTETAPNRSGTLAEAIRLGQAYKAQLNGPDVYQRIMRGVKGALAQGVTRLRTHVDVDPVAGLTGVVAALEARGAMRDLVDLQVVAFPQEGITNQPGVAELLREALRLGCSAVGGIPARDPDPEAHIQTVFALAEAEGSLVDMHVDESDNPADLTLPQIAEYTRRYGMAGRVAAGHCCSLSAQEPERRAEIIQAVREAGVHIITLPSTNLYLQGRDDQVNVRRGLAPVKELLAAGVNVTYGSDNIRDPFNPFGNGSMIESGLILAHAAHMGGQDDLETILTMAGPRAEAVLDGIHPDQLPDASIRPGIAANLVVLDATSPAEAIAGLRPPVHVFVRGKHVVHREERLSLSVSF
ncbi:amidohydrolase family protein, partial [Melaminivora alkalimesophila]|uniref:amidohydrolase family protein n=1 Tax=Melaminivora alkalimesophila TaxID=1165852 RepID=UPI000687F1D3